MFSVHNITVTHNQAERPTKQRTDLVPLMLIVKVNVQQIRDIPAQDFPQFSETVSVCTSSHSPAAVT